MRGCDDWSHICTCVTIYEFSHCLGCPEKGKRWPNKYASEITVPQFQWKFLIRTLHSLPFQLKVGNQSKYCLPTILKRARSRCKITWGSYGSCLSVPYVMSKSAQVSELSEGPVASLVEIIFSKRLFAGRKSIKHFHWNCGSENAKKNITIPSSRETNN